jgi:uncharacterized membrane protein YciS (DUF1049 family)
MKILVIVMTILLFVGIIGFVVTNLATTVNVTVWKTEYPSLPLFLVVIFAVFAGICYAGIIGVAEGAHIRLVNRRLVREIKRLETEMSYARTQPSSAPRPEPDAVPDAPEVAKRKEPRAPEPSVATAPVYGTGDDDFTSDDDEDVYSGGRAV